MALFCANKPQIKQTSHSVHSGGLVTWDVPLHHIASLYRKDSSLWTGRQRTQSCRGTRLMGLHFPVWSGDRSMPSCPISCRQFSCKNHRGAMQACLRVSIIKFSQAARTWKANEFQKLCIRQFSSQTPPILLLNIQYFVLYSSFNVSLITFINMCLCRAWVHLL